MAGSGSSKQAETTSSAPSPSPGRVRSTSPLSWAASSRPQMRMAGGYGAPSGGRPTLRRWSHPAGDDRLLLAHDHPARLLGGDGQGRDVARGTELHTCGVLPITARDTLSEPTTPHSW